MRPTRQYGDILFAASTHAWGQTEVKPASAKCKLSLNPCRPNKQRHLANTIATTENNTRPKSATELHRSNVTHVRECERASDTYVAFNEKRLICNDSSSLVGLLTDYS